MLLYLTSNKKCGLMDEAVRQMEMPVKKLVGKFSLKSFVTKDMRNYTTAKFFAVDYDSAEEALDDFTVALQSFQMMFSARIIVILSGCTEQADLLDRLISIGVVNVVTADTLQEATEEILEALSPDGMKKYLPHFNFEEPPARAVPQAPEEEAIVQYQLSAQNIRIAVAGSQRRSGATVTAFNLASWLQARGAEVAYVEANTNRHLQLLLQVYEAQPEGEHYALDGIDCYLTNELDKDYQFIIYDCGAFQTPPSVFREANIRLMCGSILPYEAPEYHRALTACAGPEVSRVALSVPKEFQEYCAAMFGDGILFAAASHDLFANRVNSHIYRPLVKGYIVGEAGARARRRL